MATLLIRGGTLVTPYTSFDDGALFARDGVIEFAGRRSELPAQSADHEVDATGMFVCPGFVDIQVNGGGGALVTEEPTVDAVRRMVAAHARFGTTSMLPTVVTSAPDRLAEALAAVRDSMRELSSGGAPPFGGRVLGSHLEGPFISKIRRGAHDERFLRDPDVALFDKLLEASGGTLRMITIAPELPGALDLINRAKAAAVITSIGHTDATYEEALAASAEGATAATHLFNAMRPLHQREPGVIGALLRMHHVVCNIIADRVHVHPALLHLAFRAKGAFGLALVTDAVVTPDESGAALGGRRLEMRDGAPYLADGTLAGSALTMDRAVRNMVESADAGLIDAIHMATATPATLLGLEKQVGTLLPGAHADIVICDSSVNIQRVFVAGREVHSASSA